MSKYEEKMKALKVLKDAIDAVNTATDAIDDFAEKFGMKPKEKTVNLADLAEMVADETGMKESCVFDALTSAFDLIKDLGLTIVMEDEDDDE
jgi:hypothetical protein